MSDFVLPSSIDRFRECEKKIRSHFRKVSSRHRNNKETYNEDTFDVSSIINVHCLERMNESTRNRLIDVQSHPQSYAYFPADEFHLYTNTEACILKIDGLPDGFYIIKNALSTPSQHVWAGIALEDYSSAPHNNLTNLESINTDHSDINELKSPNMPQSLWQSTISEDNGFEKFKPLRWASLGYHYNWTLRMYCEDLKSTFPNDLRILCKHLANYVGENMTAEAAIVNFYPCGACMSGHLDDAEQAMDEAIVSISLGCPAVFLMGGKTKDIVPTPVLVASGDVLIMAGESRACYHGIACVLSHNDLGLDLSSSTRGGGDGKDMVQEYLQQGRININARRVVSSSGRWVNKQGTGAQAPYVS